MVLRNTALRTHITLAHMQTVMHSAWDKATQNEPKENAMKLIGISKAKPGQLPYSKHTLYKWHSQGKHPRLVRKVLCKVFFDCDEWEKVAKG